MRKLTLFILLAALLASPEFLFSSPQEYNFKMSFSPTEKLTLGKFAKVIIEKLKMHNPKYKYKTVILPDDLDKKEINIILSDKEIYLSEAQILLENVLDSYGYMLIYNNRKVKRKNEVRNEGEVKIVKQSGSERPTKLAVETFPEVLVGDQYVTYLVQLKYINGEKISKILQELSKSAIFFKESNFFLITDSGNNIKRLLKIISKLDVKDIQPGFFSYKCQFISAEKAGNEFIKKFEKLFIKEVNAFPVPSSNSLLIIAGNEDYELIRKLFENIDNETFYYLENFEILHLKHISTDKMQKHIEAVFFTKIHENSLKILPDERLNALIVAYASDKAGKMIGKIQDLVKELDIPSELKYGNLRMYQLRYAKADKVKGILENTILKAISGKKEADESGADAVYLDIDERTNTLVITAPEKKHAVIQEVINELDSFSPQVMVEVLIVEVSLRKSRTLGIEWSQINAQHSGQGWFGSSDQSMKSNITTDPGLKIGRFNGPVDLDKLSKGEYAEMSKIEALIYMNENNSDFHILSAPRVFVQNNQQAKIIVGEKIATPMGLATTVNTGTSNITNFEYKDVGIELVLTPVINDSKNVTLVIKQTISKRLEEKLYQFEIPVITNREASTTVSVSSGDTIVLGGMVSEDKTKIIDKTPVLGDIPVLGSLFRKNRYVTRTTDLQIYITPYIQNKKDFVDSTRLRPSRRSGSDGNRNFSKFRETVNSKVDKANSKFKYTCN